jgi:DNA-binding winged helix-turn-helix (wHTH) protein/TolB-like protein
MHSEDLYRFGPYVLSAGERVLRRNGEPVDLPPKAVDLLLALVARQGAVITKEELRNEVWDVHVELNSVERQISALRKALDDTGEYIETLPKRGYRFRESVTLDVPTGIRPVAGNSPQKPHGYFWIAAGTALVITALTTWRFYHPLGVLARPAVAVFSFRSADGNSDLEWLSPGLAEMFRTEIAAGGKLRTIPAEDVQRARMELKLPAVDSMGKESLARLRKSLGADYVLLGSFAGMHEGAARRIRVDAKLQDARTGDIVASTGRSGSFTSLFDLVTQSAEMLRGAGSDRLIPRNPEAARLYSEGLARLRVYDPKGATEFFADAVKSEADFAAIHSALAEAWFTLGYQTRAREAAAKAMALRAGLPREQALAIEARYHEMLGEWDRAVVIHQALWTFYPDDPEHGLHLAQAQIRARKGSAAFTTIAELRKRTPQINDEPTADLVEAIAAESQGDSRAELAAARRAIAKGQAVGATLLVARAELRAAWALDKLSQWDEASRFAYSAQTTFAAFGDRTSAANAQQNIADILDDRGDHAVAIPAYDKAIAQYREIGNQEGFSLSLNNQGWAWMALGNLDSAAQDFAESSRVSKLRGDSKWQALALNGLATVLEHRGDLHKARDLYEKAISAITETGDKGRRLEMLESLAVVLRDEGNLEESWRAAAESYALAKQLGNRSDAGLAQCGMGDVLIRRGELQAARKIFQQVIADAAASQDESLSATAVEGLGRAELEQGDRAAARADLEEALRLHTKLNEQELSARTLTFLARLNLEENRYSEAANAARQADTEFVKERELDQEALADALLSRALAGEQKGSEAVNLAHRALQRAVSMQNVWLRAEISRNLAGVFPRNQRSQAVNVYPQ